MKATRLCNLRCSYCHAWKEGPNQVMEFEVLAKTTRDALRHKAVRVVNFVWHGGETTLLPIGFYKKALWLQQQFKRADQEISNSLQTNATRLNDEWIRFFAATDMEVGVSIDGPPEVHDARRRTAGGAPTWAQVHAGVTALQEAGVKCGALIVVDRAIVNLGAERLLEFLLELRVPGVALLNVLPDNSSTTPPAGAYLPFSNYIKFLAEVFRLWWPVHRRALNIRELSALVNNVLGHQPNLCVLAGNCMGQFLTIEPEGNVGACDKYIGDEQFYFGNVREAGLNALLARSANLKRAQVATGEEVTKMRQCRWASCCRGGCPHDRRLDQLYTDGWDGSCCGLAELLDEISEALDNEAGSTKEQHARKYQSDRRKFEGTQETS